MVRFAQVRDRQPPTFCPALYVRSSVQGKSPGFVAAGVDQVRPHLDLMEKTAFQSQDLGWIFQSLEATWRCLWVRGECLFVFMWGEQ